MGEPGAHAGAAETACVTTCAVSAGDIKWRGLPPQARQQKLAMVRIPGAADGNMSLYNAVYTSGGDSGGDPGGPVPRQPAAPRSASRSGSPQILKASSGQSRARPRA